MRTLLRATSAGSRCGALVGGIASARRAAMHGAKVGLAEVSQLGGTCVNVGCVPKKVSAHSAAALPWPHTQFQKRMQVMYNAANIAATFKDAAGYGFTDLGSPRVDWGLLKQRRDAYVQRLNGIYMRNLEASGVKLHHGFARFVGEKQVEVAGQIITVRRAEAMAHHARLRAGCDVHRAPPG